MRLKLITAAILGLGFTTSAWAVSPFTIQDIRIEGLQRTQPATVFSYMPVKIGDTFTDADAPVIIQRLFATGLFEDIHVDTDGRQVLLTVIERPVISNLNITGAKSIEGKLIKQNLQANGIGEGQVFNPQAFQEALTSLQQAYQSRGRDNAQITPTITKLDRNRVSVDIAINEGPVTKINQITFTGNQHFSSGKLLRQMKMSSGNMLSWLTKSNQFSQEKMNNDLKSLDQFYQDNGYFDFKINNVDVHPEPGDKTKLVVAIEVSEGNPYRWGDITINGDTREVPVAELEKLTRGIKKGRTYKRSDMINAVKAIQDRMGEAGYAASQVSVMPQPHPDSGIVDFVLSVDAGRKIYVRNITIEGNNKTRDEVIRREFRQMESAPYDSAKIQRSKQRLDQLGYFESTKIDMVPVEGTPDQVDLKTEVKERNTGSVNISVGYAQGDGLVLSGSVAQDNLFGTGKSVNASVSNSKVNKALSLSFTDPYFTPDGVSLGYDLFWKQYDPHADGTNNYSTRTIGAGARLGVPISETDRINFGLGVNNMQVTTYDGAPLQYVDFMQRYGNVPNGIGKANFWTINGNIGWGRNTTDSAVWPTRGYVMNAGLDAGLPGGDLQYYKLSHQQTWFFPLSDNFTLMLNGQVGYAGGYGKTPELPFFHNFYGGGLGSVRGYQNGSLGPKAIANTYASCTNATVPPGAQCNNGMYQTGSTTSYFGGRYLANANAELLFPMPGLSDQRSVRFSLFADAGSVWDGKTYNSTNTNGFYRSEHKSSFTNELRYSAGVALTWLSPVGPIKLSYAVPLKKEPTDQIQRFQFQLGTTF